jgi:hypothetical protein
MIVSQVGFLAITGSTSQTRRVVVPDGFAGRGVERGGSVPACG